MSAPRPSLSRTVWVAIALHLAVAVAVARAPRPSRGTTPETHEPSDVMDLDLGVVSPPSAAPEPAPLREEPPPRPEGAARVASREMPGPATTGEVGEPAAEGPTEPSAAPVASAPSTAPVQLVKPGYHVPSGANPFLGRAAESEPTETAAAQERVEQALRQPARQRELELGLGPDGPVRTALADAAAEGRTDVTGKAVFLAIADGSGAVLSVSLLSCDGGRAGWADAARAAFGKLRGTKLRLPSSAKRAEVTIEVSSEWKMPSGHDPGVDVELFHIPVKKGEGKNATKVTILDPIPKLTTVEIAKDVKITIPQVNLTILGTNGDPADVGAKPRRIIHTRVVESKVL